MKGLRVIDGGGIRVVCVIIDVTQVQGEQRTATRDIDANKAIAQHRRYAKQALKYRGLTGTIATICREEGPRAVYNGLAPGLHRQLVFASIRIGLYDDVKRIYSAAFKGIHRSLCDK